jgi:hypothetical protein
MPNRGRPFQAGNTFGRGRPRGSRNKLSSVAKEMLVTYGDSLMRKAIADALQGDVATRRLLITRLLNAGSVPNRKLKNLPIRTAAEIVTVSEAMVHEVTAGQLTPDEGQKISHILDSHRKAIETANLEKRIAQLESKS